jgi:hypothetical protein
LSWHTPLQVGRSSILAVDTAAGKAAQAPPSPVNQFGLAPLGLEARDMKFKKKRKINMSQTMILDLDPHHKSDSKLIDGTWRRLSGFPCGSIDCQTFGDLLRVRRIVREAFTKPSEALALFRCLSEVEATWLTAMYQEHCNGYHGFLDGYYFYRLAGEYAKTGLNLTPATYRLIPFFVVAGPTRQLARES